MPSGILWLLDLVTAKELRRLKGKDGYATPERWDVSRLSEDGRMLLTQTHEPATIYLWEVTTGRE